MGPGTIGLHVGNCSMRPTRPSFKNAAQLACTYLCIVHLTDAEQGVIEADTSGAYVFLTILQYCLADAAFLAVNAPIQG